MRIYLDMKDNKMKKKKKDNENTKQQNALDADKAMLI